MQIKRTIKRLFDKFDYLRAYNSPFKPPNLKWYCGKIAVGTPYFFPRKWINNKDKPGYLTAVPKKIGFDFVELGWKTKWESYIFEWAPRISFVFFKWQIAVIFVVPEADHYWESWLYYTRKTDKTKSIPERIAQCKKEAPCTWTTHYPNKEKETTDYYDIILKDKWL